MRRRTAGEGGRSDPSWPVLVLAVYLNLCHLGVGGGTTNALLPARFSGGFGVCIVANLLHAGLGVSVGHVVWWCFRRSAVLRVWCVRRSSEAFGHDGTKAKVDEWSSGGSPGQDFSGAQILG